jgi:hypothetical protein
MKLTLKGGAIHEIPDIDIRMWRHEFPKIDVDQELRSMAAWCDANPSKRKTARGVRRFIVSWLMRSSEKAKPKEQIFAAAHKKFEPERKPQITREGAERGLAMLKGAMKR